MFKRKSQSSIELIVILVFVFIIIALIMYYIGTYSIQTQDNSIKKERDDFAGSLISEVDLLQKVRGGYTREIEIPSHIIEKYNVSIQDPYLIVEDHISENGEKYFYEIPGNGSQSVSIYREDKDSNGVMETYFYLHKPKEKKIGIKTS